ncbi:serine/threonine-protein kinase [Antrihabitans sp. YC2-6]|uniref:serine/threonine-protein kinase n=1 Tax=Antrihabitans sp. YC2-6 TaxID=2799498 RepID=UPI0018F49EAE|nr:serine/threonine-protein kinase [Antrihabitans sp. YC2-6]MBJ8347612.1 protein kinase [Antrihabitans sp. YC2-6]
MSEIVDNRFALLKSAEREGAGGQVVRAVDIENNGAKVAIKFIKGHRDDPTTRMLFERETQSLTRLDHPNIVRFIDAGWHEERGQFYLVLDWVERDMHTLLKSPDWADWDDFSERYAIPLLAGLAHAHLKEVIHRDIKPLNVLVDDAGNPMLADFGVAKLRDKVETLGQTMFGWHTRPYSPPDACVGYEYTRDVWAMAVVFIEAMSSEPLLDYPEIDPRISEIKVPPAVRSLLEACVNSEASLRPSNGAVFLQQLEEIQAKRRARRLQADATLWLDLSRRAASEISSGDEDAKVAASRDLVTQCRAEYRFDAASAKLDRETVYLWGATRRYIAKHDRRINAFRVTSAATYELFDSRRNSTCAVEHLLTISFSNPGKTKAEAGAKMLVAALEGHYDNSTHLSDQEEDSKSSTVLLDRYLDLLYAREELERGDRKPIQFGSISILRSDVTFSLSEPLNLDCLGQEWEIRIGRGRSFGRGEVVAQKGESLTLRFGRIPKTIPKNGELTPFLGPTQRAHERQVDAVASIRDGSIPRPDLRTFVSDPSSVRIPVLKYPKEWVRSDLDESKRNAVAAALGTSDFLVIEGPPGTGKTSFITELVAQTIIENPEAKILIVSQTHVAVDNALERLVSAGLKNIIRLSKPEDPKVAASVQHLILDRQMAEWAKGVEQKAEARIASLAVEQGMPLRHLRAALALQKLAVVLGDLQHIEARQRRGLDPDTLRSETVNGLEQLRDREEMQDRLELLRSQSRELLVEAIQYAGDDLPINEDIDREGAQIAVELLLGTGDYSKRLLALVALQGEWLQRVATDQNLVNAFLDTGSVLAGTCVGFLGHRAVKDLEFDLCILDEASKATATEALVPLARAKKWVLVGDVCQLPPLDEELLRNRTIMGRYSLDEEFVKETLFERFVEKTSTSVRHLLREQYRMIRPIGDLISTTFYDGALVSPKKDSVPGIDRLGKPVLWISTSGLGRDRFEGASSPGVTSHLNRTESKLCMQRLTTIDRAIEKGLVNPRDRRLSVLLIAPYLLQMEELERHLSYVDLTHLDVTVQSVDAVQGREADLTVFSITRSNVKGELGFLRQQYWRRINVALSRARYGLTLIGDLEFCVGQPGALRDVALYMRQKAEDCEVRDA